MLLAYCFSQSLYAQINIGVVGKTKNDSFYQQSYQGCLKFAESHPEVNCIYDGPDDYQDIRSQAIIIDELIKKGIDGLMFSTTDSTFLVERVLKDAYQRQLPVIAFDSDLLPEHKKYRLAYVGTDNFDYGRALARYAKTVKKSDNNVICLQSGHKTTPNLNKRIEGVRFELAGEKVARLNGHNGWTEHIRCPLYSLGKRADALNQLKFVLDQKRPPIFIAVAGFAQFNPDYVKTIRPYRNKILTDEITLISADTEDIQLRALAMGLSDTNIGQNPYEMGRKSAELLYQFITQKQKPAQSNYFLKYHYCLSGNADVCTKNY